MTNVRYVNSGGVRLILPNTQQVHHRRHSHAVHTPSRSRRNSSVATTASRRIYTTNQISNHRGGCSLDRDGNHLNGNHLQAVTNGREQQLCSNHTGSNPTRSNSSSHLNERIVTECGSVGKLINRAAFYRPYNACTTIGRGNFARVFLLQKSANHTSEKLAVKEIDKDRMAGRVDYVYNEIYLLNQCEHENICQLIEAHESPSYFFLVFEFAPFGDLFEFIKQTGIPGEANCACITYQIGSALDYLHTKKFIVHRDVKPENILIMSECWVKLTDFGLACTMLGPLYRLCGTPTYVAPEIIEEKGYGVEVDIWSLGICLHIALIGYAPFRASHRSQLFKLIKRAQLQFDLPRWSHISIDAQATVRKMLNPNPRKRVSAFELLQEDEWIRSYMS